MRCIDHFTEQKAFSDIACHAAFDGGSVYKVSDKVILSSLQGEVVLCSLRPMYRLEDPRSLLPNRCRRVKWSKRDASQVISSLEQRIIYGDLIQRLVYACTAFCVTGVLDHFYRLVA
jgi:hypothetical protein